MSLRDQMRQELKELAKLAATMPKAPSAPPASPGTTELPRELSASHRTIPPMVASLPSPSPVAGADAQQANPGGTWRRGVQATLAIAGLAAVVVGGVAVGRLLTSSAPSPAHAAVAPPGPVTDLDEPLAPATAPSPAKGSVVNADESGAVKRADAPSQQPAEATASNPGAAPMHRTLPSPTVPSPKAIVSRPATSPTPSTTPAATPASLPVGGQLPTDLLQQMHAAVQSHTKN